MNQDTPNFWYLNLPSRPQGVLSYQFLLINWRNFFPNSIIWHIHLLVLDKNWWKKACLIHIQLDICSSQWPRRPSFPIYGMGKYPWNTVTVLSFIGWPYQIPVSESGIGPFLPFIYALLPTHFYIYLILFCLRWMPPLLSREDWFAWEEIWLKGFLAPLHRMDMAKK